MEDKKSFLGKAIDDIKESAKKQHEIDKENFETIKIESKKNLEAAKTESKKNFEEAQKVDPDFQEFLDAKGIKEKAKVVTKHAVRDGKKLRENAEKVSKNN